MKKQLWLERMFIFVLSAVALLCLYYELRVDRMPTRRDWVALLVIEILLQFIITPKHKKSKTYCNDCPNRKLCE